MGVHRNEGGSLAPTSVGDVQQAVGATSAGQTTVSLGGVGIGSTGSIVTLPMGATLNQNANGGLTATMAQTNGIIQSLTIGPNAAISDTVSTSGWNYTASTQGGATGLTLDGQIWNPGVSTLTAFANGTLSNFFTGQTTDADTATTAQLDATPFDPSSAIYQADETAVAAAGALPTAGQDDNYSSAATSPTDNSSLTLVDYNSTGATTTSSWSDSAYTTDNDDDLDDTDDDDPFQYAGSDDPGDDYGPLAVDLTGTGVQFTAQQNSQAYFDIAGTGVKTRVGWIGPNAGFLVFDGSGVGPVAGTQMVGQSFSLNGQAAPTRQASCFNANLFDPKYL